jgi:hypothetical protein
MRVRAVRGVEQRDQRPRIDQDQGARFLCIAVLTEALACLARATA